MHMTFPLWELADVTIAPFRHTHMLLRQLAVMHGMDLRLDCDLGDDDLQGVAAGAFVPAFGWSPVVLPLHERAASCRYASTSIRIVGTYLWLLCGLLALATDSGLCQHCLLCLYQLVCHLGSCSLCLSSLLGSFLQTSASELKGLWLTLCIGTCGHGHCTRSGPTGG